MKITIKSNGKITSAQIQEIQRKNENIGIKTHEIKRTNLLIIQK